MSAQKKVAFYTLGCKLNFSETSTIARNFQSEGFERVKFEETADIYVINTCSVTDNADKRFKTIVKNALKKNEKAFLIAIGCYAQLKPEELAHVDGVDLVLGATEKFKVTNYINDLSKNDMGEVHSCEIEAADFYVGNNYREHLLPMLNNNYYVPLEGKGIGEQLQYLKNNMERKHDFF